MFSKTNEIGSAPCLNPNLPGISKVEQIAFVVPDLDEGMSYWEKTFGVGPFYVRRNVSVAEFQFEGEKSAPVISLAQAWCGNFQIELLQQHNDAPSVLRKFVPSYNTIHHVGVRTRDHAADQATLLAAGYRLVQHVATVSGSVARFYYGGQGFGLVEMIYLPDDGAGWDKMRAAAASWDGTTRHVVS